MAKLNRVQTDEIRGLYAGGLTQSAIAARFGVSQAVISKVVGGWSPTEKVAKPEVCCSFEDEDGQCPKPARALGLCTKHYQRFKAHGDPAVVIVQQPWPDRICTVEGCGQLRETSRLYCEKHRARVRRHGDPHVALKDHTPAVERWKTSYAVDAATGCWNWIGTIARGYGRITDGAQNQYFAHRFVWIQVVGLIPKGYVIDHHNPDFGCHNKCCVNPEHLEAVPQAINALRGEVNKNKTHCKNGHEFTEANTYNHPVTGWRQCRACLRALHRAKRYQYAYIYLYRPGHPLAKGKIPKVMEHRMVLYDAIGAGPHPCHWGCGRTMNWGGIQGIHVDHINGDPSDNRRENLVPSCQSCNKSRAKAGNLVDWVPRGVGEFG